MWSNVVMGQQQQQRGEQQLPGQDGAENNSSSNTIKGPEPSGRYKHAVTLAGDDLYMYGGKAGHATLKDFWKLQLRGGSWTQIQPNNANNKTGLPPPLQEHTLIHHNGSLYMFGGQIGLTDTNSVPLWIYSIKMNEWRKWEGSDGPKSVPAGGRRGHVAAIYADHMLIHGGYRDLMGSLGDLWAFHFETESWHLFHNHSTPTWYSMNNSGPLPRHNHGGLTHARSLYLIGGMHNLDEKSDFWKYDLNLRRWTQLKAKPMPGPLKSPAITKALGSLFVLGGERNGRALDEFWRFSFESEVWERITIHGIKPSAKLFPAVVMLPALIKAKTVPCGQNQIEHIGNGKYFDDDDDDGSTSPNNYWWDYGPKNGHNSNFTNKLTTSTCILVDSGVPNYQIIDEHHVEQCGIVEYEHSRIDQSSQNGQPRRSESAYCMNTGQQSSLSDKCRVKKSNSVRFHDQTITIGNSRQLPTSDYSSMETIGEQRISTSTSGFENPNYRSRPPRPATIANLSDHQHPRGRGHRVSPRGGTGLIGDLIEMDEFGDDQQLLSNPLQQQQQYEITTPNYLLMIGGLESNSGLNSQLLGKKPLAIWRLRVSKELFH